MRNRITLLIAGLLFAICLSASAQDVIANDPGHHKIREAQIETMKDSPSVQVVDAALADAATSITVDGAMIADRTSAGRIWTIAIAARVKSGMSADDATTAVESLAYLERIKPLFPKTANQRAIVFEREARFLKMAKNDVMDAVKSASAVSTVGRFVPSDLGIALSTPLSEVFETVDSNAQKLVGNQRMGLDNLFAIEVVCRMDDGATTGVAVAQTASRWDSADVDFVRGDIAGRPRFIWSEDVNKLNISRTMLLAIRDELNAE